MVRVIGLMSGTSVDGIDTALVEVEGGQTDLQATLLASRIHPYPEALRQQILRVCQGEPLPLEQLAQLDDAVAICFAEAAIALQAGQSPADLIGSHGQTVFHRPGNDRDPLSYSLQIGRGALIAHLTGIPTVSNFRVADIAVGGQGAPLVPPVDLYLLGDPQEHRCIQNIGGIGNVTYLPARNAPDWQTHLRGWDTGPGNSLLDLAVAQLSQGQLAYDEDGAWAASGKPCQPLVEQWLQHPYFHQAPPKSTGRELFGPFYLDQCQKDAVAQGLSDADLLASLSDLTAASIALNYRLFLPQMPDRVLLCGGGTRNRYLCQRIQHHLPGIPIASTATCGVDPDYKEAIAFAVLAHWHHQGLPGNLPAVTGAQYPVLLGELHPPSQCL
jgi:anhydro-N-acetylmuramic acid kinase